MTDYAKRLDDILYTHQKDTNEWFALGLYFVQVKIWMYLVKAKRVTFIDHAKTTEILQVKKLTWINGISIEDDEMNNDKFISLIENYEAVRMANSERYDTEICR